MAAEKEQADMRADEGAGSNEPSQTVLQIPPEGHNGEAAAGDKPPDYEAAPTEDVPSSSLIRTVQEVRREPGAALSLLGRLLARLGATLGLTYMLAVSVVLPIAMLVMGAMHLNNCPVQKYIPIYMLVGGIFGVGKLLMDISNRCIKIRNSKRNTITEQRKGVGALDGLLSCFVIAWFVAGCVWIYGAHLPDFADPSNPNFCNKGLYYFAFGVVTSTLVILGIVIAGFCCIGFVIVLLAASGSSSS